MIDTQIYNYFIEIDFNMISVWQTRKTSNSQHKLTRWHISFHNKPFYSSSSGTDNCYFRMWPMFHKSGMPTSKPKKNPPTFVLIGHRSWWTSLGAALGGSLGRRAAWYPFSVFTVSRTVIAWHLKSLMWKKDGKQYQIALFILNKEVEKDKTM